MRIIDPNMLAQLGSSVYRPAYLLQTTIDSNILRFTSLDSAVGYNGDMYVPRGMDIGSIGYGTSNIANGCSVKVDDIDRTLYTSLGSVASDNWDVKLTLVVLDSAGIVVSGGVTTLFSGFITEWSYSSGKMNMRLKSPFVKWSGSSPRLFSTSCTVKVFKSVQCGYSGSGVECNRTYKQCKLYGNQQNFQGFPWLEDLASRRVDVTGKVPPPAELPVYTGRSILQRR